MTDISGSNTVSDGSNGHYTPTTEEVRWQFSTDSPSEFMPEQFDRWLAEVKAQVWDEAERRGRDNERALMMCQAQLRPSNSAVLIKNPYRQGEEQ